MEAEVYDWQPLWKPFLLEMGKKWVPKEGADNTATATGGMIGSQAAAPICVHYTMIHLFFKVLMWQRTNTDS